MVVIKFENGTYWAGYRKNPAKTLLGAQIYKSEKAAQTMIDKSTNFGYGLPTNIHYSIIEVELREKVI